MNIKALITSLVLGSSSLAMAQPVSFGASAGVSISAGLPAQGVVDIRDHRTNDWPWIRDHRQPVEQPAVVMQPPAPVVDNCANVATYPNGSEYTGPVASAMRGQWVALTQPTKIGIKREEIRVGAQKGLFHTLQLVPTSGSTYISTVAIVFPNGAMQSVPVNQTLTGALTINVGAGYRGRAIQRIVVNGSSDFGARYSILAA